MNYVIAIYLNQKDVEEDNYLSFYTVEDISDETFIKLIKQYYSNIQEDTISFQYFPHLAMGYGSFNTVEKIGSEENTLHWAVDIQEPLTVE